jgi:hypothetical protein
VAVSPLGLRLAAAVPPERAVNESRKVAWALGHGEEAREEE